MRLLYNCPVHEGGLAEYARRQGEALAAQPELKVLWHAPSSLCAPKGVQVIEPLPTVELRPNRSKLRRAFDFIRTTVETYRLLDQAIAKHKPDAVMLSAWAEYLSPLWAWRLRKWHNRNVYFGALIHDPIRDYRVGPSWWHTRSIQEAYSFIDIAFVHEKAKLELYTKRNRLKTVVIPHGPYPVPFPENIQIQADAKKDLRLPEDCFILLSFGHIRDGKNLDLLIEVLKNHPETHLLIAGRQQSAGQRTVEDYKIMAEKLGVVERCHWFNDYIPNDEVWKYFVAADAIALTYSANFRSASGVLNVNAQFRKPVLASSGQSPLKSAIENYNLGIWVEPDSVDTLSIGLNKLIETTGSQKANWDKYETDHSWERNARRVVNALIGR